MILPGTIWIQTERPKPTLLEIALENASRGWFVFPCKPRDKYPITPNGWHDATRDEAKIRAWWTKTPNANVGIACGMSGLAVLDIDTGLTDSARAVNWMDRNGLSLTYAVRTGRRPGFAMQFYYDGAMPDVHGWEHDGCKGDIKSLGGYVLAAGSVHPSGEPYHFLYDGSSHNAGISLCKTPDSMRALKSPNKGSGKNLEPVLGGRHAYLTSVAGKMRNAGLSVEAMELALLQHNADVCQPPIPDEDVRHIAKSVGRYDVPERAPEVTIGKSEQQAPAAPAEPVDWRTHYHSFEQMDTAPPASFLIEGFLQQDAITALAAPVAQRKSLISLNVAHALCTGEPLFGYFKVARKPERVLYLCPEMGIRSFTDRVRLIGLLPYVGKTLFCRTMSAEGALELAELTVEELTGSVVIIDTAIRYLKGDENSSQDMRVFAQSIFHLMRDGALSILLLHHSAKGTKESADLSLENIMRGSGELGAFISSCWATRLQDPTEPYSSPSFLINVKQRDFESKPFEASCDKTCKMQMLGEPGAVRLAKPTNVPNKDGREDEAVKFIVANPDMSLRDVGKGLKELGINRGRTWISDKRFDLLGRGCKVESETKAKE